MTLKLFIKILFLIICLLLLFISSLYLYFGIYDELFEKIEKKFLGKLNEKKTLMNPKITFLWKIDLNTDFPES